jgi:hypothetical protein
MPRTSAEAHAAIATAIPSERIDPPPGLTEEQAAEWRQIVSRFPPDHFGGENVPLLAELVRHTSFSRQLAEQLARMRNISLTLTTPRGAKQRSLFRQLLSMHVAESKAIMALSVKLRLANSSYRLDSSRDERASRMVPNGPRPWDDWGRNDGGDHKDGEGGGQQH